MMLSTPRFEFGSDGPKLMLAVESMRRHMTDEGWQIALALQHAGYILCGFDLPENETDVAKLIRKYNPSVVVVQDKREWEGITADRSRDPRMRFQNVESLAGRPDIFKVSILKDAHQDNEYQTQSATEMGCHSWIVYYDVGVVSKLAPFVRPQHLIRTRHTIDSEIIPQFSNHSKGTIITGAVSGAYPLRSRIVKEAKKLKIDVLPHPGYHRKGSNTPEFLKTISQYKVSICTCSKFNYLLRKVIESVACGCIVVTDLPPKEVVPQIDNALVRVSSDWPIQRIGNLCRSAEESYDPEFRKKISDIAKIWYDYRFEGERLAKDIEKMRLNYANVVCS